MPHLLRIIISQLIREPDLLRQRLNTQSEAGSPGKKCRVSQIMCDVVGDHLRSLTNFESLPSPVTSIHIPSYEVIHYSLTFML